MARVKVVADMDGNFYSLRFLCPGCAKYKDGTYQSHSVHVANWLPEEMGASTRVTSTAKWTFNGDLDSPTLSPSVLTWATNPSTGADIFRCHSFVTNGKIQFLGDCSHELKNQTIELPEIPVDDEDLSITPLIRFN